MKKLLILAAALLTLGAVAQNKEEEAISKKIAKSDEMVADAKKSLQPNTWITRADAFIEAANLYSNKLIAGFAAETLLTPMGAADSIVDVTYSGMALKKHSYQAVDIYVNDKGLIQYWQVKKEYIKDALKKAYDALVKAKEVDADVFAKKATATVMRLDNQLQTEGMAAYSLSQPIVAARMFDGSCAAKELLGKVDTASTFYAGVAYMEGKDYRLALDRLEKAISLGFLQDGSVYYYVGSCHDALGNKDAALKAYETGFEKFPANKSVMAGLINTYMTLGKNTDQLIEIVKKAQGLDPQNVSLYLVESNVWDKLGDKVKAEEALVRAIAIAPKDFSVYYNYAILKVLHAESVIQAANKLDLNDTENYNKMINEAIALQKTAIEKLEKAYEIDATNISAVDLLRQLYFPRRDDSPEMQKRYDFFNGLYEKLTAK
ncbi:MAG: tetratricopeptide repeat protein [Mucinivorans sp.]